MLVVANWKAYVDTPQKAKALFASAKRLSASAKRAKLIIAPPFPFLGVLAPGNRSKVKFAGQDLTDTVSSAVTGEVSGVMLKGLGAEYVIVGHSERRRRGDTNEVVIEKLRRAFAAKLTPILCVGETERDEDAQYLSFLKEELVSAFEAITPRERLSLIVAYEPIWAIGKSSADAMAPRDVAEMVLYIKKVLSPYATGTYATKVLYGGSVEPDNVRALAKDGGVDGFLVGHASADAAQFSALVKAVA